MDEHNQLEYKFIKLANDETLAYRELGNGTKPIIMLHGNLCTSKHWEVMNFYFFDKPYRFYQIDQRGFGRSSYNKPIESMIDLSNDVKLFMDALHLNQAIVVGWSLGGAVAMQLAILYPDCVEKLMLIDSLHVEGHPPYLVKDPNTNEKIKQTDVKLIEQRGKRIEKILKQKDIEFLKIVFNSRLFTGKQRQFEKNWEKYIHESFLQRNYCDIIKAMHFFNIGKSGTNEAKKINCPVLILHGENDRFINVKKAKDNAIQIGKEKCLVVIKKNCGHGSAFGFPKDCANTILTFAKAVFNKQKTTYTPKLKVIEQQQYSIQI